jgi:hypothetical protein
MGAILLVTLSVSAAFGAKPTDTDAPRGQSIAAFVHDLVFGSEETDDEVNEDEDEDVVEDDEDEDSDEEDDELVDDDAERQVPEEFANHGACVVDAIHDTEGFEASEAETFGAWVSMNAQYVCWSLEPPTDEADADAAEEEDDADEASAKEQRKAERAAARAERKAEREAARAERHAAKAAGFAAQRGGGQANGRGGGRH